jgi:hypothetical protein
MRHNPERGIMQSIFSPAVREHELDDMGNLVRTGGLKMDWTKPLH